MQRALQVVACCTMILVLIITLVTLVVLMSSFVAV